MWKKIKAWFGKIWAWLKKYFHYVVLALVAAGSFLAGRRSLGSSRDFDKLRADNTRLRQQIEGFRAEYERLVNLNRLNEQQLNGLARQLEIAGRIARQAGTIDSGNAGDIERLRENNKRLAEWILENGAKLQDNENSGN